MLGAVSARVLPWPSCSGILEVGVEDVRTASAHLGALDIGCAGVKLGLIPLALLKLVPPLHTLLGRHLRLRLVLINVQAPELLDLQVLARVLGGVLVHLLREIGHREANVIRSLRRRVLLRYVEPMMVSNCALPVGGELGLRIALHLHVERKLVLIGLIHLLLRKLQLIGKVEGVGKWAHRLVILLVLLEALLLVHLRCEGHLLGVLGEGRGVAVGRRPFTSHRRLVPHRARVQ
mmetsp:Transcript_129033/g.306110  ORF Transcript_129033/g.306110 Transcript_129033/m.306110 type:complete len:234 (+) Transcript_129033:19-720(+)